MKRCAPVLTAIVLAALATTAFAQNGRRGGGAPGGERQVQERGPERGPERGEGPGRYGGGAPAYGAGRAYGPPPVQRYAPPAPPAQGRYAAPQGRYYGAPAPYEPPLAPQPYRSEANSLGAQWAQQQDQAQMGVRRGAIMPLSRVVSNLQRLRPGRVLDAGMETAPDGRATYRVRWAATGGRRIDFIIDAATGAVIGRGAE